MQVMIEADLWCGVYGVGVQVLGVMSRHAEGGGLLVGSDDGAIGGGAAK